MCYAWTMSKKRDEREHHAAAIGYGHMPQPGCSRARRLPTADEQLLEQDDDETNVRGGWLASAWERP